ncbi:endolytic transglycosylase MltG [Candidatus Parcubacteria bacterium]|nr:endolytic transglycosylase MltG [Candidatus Parcubacteria bacterium]
MTRNKKIAIIGGIILVVGIPIGIYQCLFSSPQKGLEMERIVINLDTTEEELIPKLKEQGYIRSERAFKFVLKTKGWQGKIKPGAYKISKNMNALILADTLVRFPYQRWVVTPEGLRKEEIADIAKKELGWSEKTKEEFLANANEGYLFPDTYLLQVLNFEDAGEQVAKRMENRFNEKCQAIFKEFEEANIRNDTAIILSSIIQREAANEEEMPLIAGIIWNRLLKPMPLQVDATIQYIVGEEGNWWRPVTPEEYKIESPYNTYLHEGRPPAPICNPGLAAIEAVVHDQSSDYFYYLHDSEGQIHSAKTYKEHQMNIEQYLLEATTGTITDIALSAKVITLLDEQEKEISVAITEKTALLDKDENKLELKDFQLGDSITAAGRWTDENTFIPSIIRKK